MAEKSSTTDPTAVIEPPVPAGAPISAAPPPAVPPPHTAPVPTAPTPAPASAPVGWVIAAMILFWPTGILALLASHRSARAIGAADVDAAVRETQNARRWSIISVIVGGVLIVVSALVSIVWVALVAVAVHDRDGRTEFGPGRGLSNELPFDAPDLRGQSNNQGSDG